MNKWSNLANGRCLWVGWYHGHGVEVYLEPSTRAPGRWSWAVGINRRLFERWTLVSRSPAVDKEAAIREAFARLSGEVIKREGGR